MPSAKETPNTHTATEVSKDVMPLCTLCQGRLMSRDAPHAQVRCALNLGLPPNAEPLPLVPQEVEKEKDAQSCFVGAEHIDFGELSDEDDLQEERRHSLRPPTRVRGLLCKLRVPAGVVLVIPAISLGCPVVPGMLAWKRVKQCQ